MVPDRKSMTLATGADLESRAMTPVAKREVVVTVWGPVA